MKLIIAFVAITTVVLLISCGETSTTSESAPANAAREWIEAVINSDGLGVINHTCLGQQEKLQISPTMFPESAILSKFFSDQAKFAKDRAPQGDISDIRFETIDQREDQAKVHVFGEFQITDFGEEETLHVDEHWQMIKEDDSWQWCGSYVEGLSRVLANTSKQQVSKNVDENITDPNGALAQGPTYGAREWIDAITNLDGNRILKHTCLAQRDKVKDAGMWTSAFMVLGQMLTNRSVQVEGDVSDLKFETISDTGAQAEVRVYGELRVAVLGSAEAYQVDERWRMIYENETWRWCGNLTEQLPGRRIAFTSDRVKKWESDIYVMNTDGSDLTRLTYFSSESHIFGSYAWSPDGEQIAYVSVKDGPNATWYIDVINSDGSGNKRLFSNEGFQNSPILLASSWSPDGRQIVFTSNRDGNNEIYVINADGSGLTRLTDTPAQENLPLWSPSGQQIGFISNRDGNNEIYVINADGSGLTRLTDNAAHDYFYQWSPDSQQIAFLSAEDPGKTEFVNLINADGSGLKHLTDGRYSYLAWSPDGQLIALNRFNPTDLHEAYIIERNGSNLRRLTEKTFTFRSWSPDNKWLAGTCRLDGEDDEVCMLNVDSGNLIQLTDDAASDGFPVWSP